VVIRAEGLSRSYELWKRPSSPLTRSLLKMLGGTALLPRRAREFCEARAEAECGQFPALSEVSLEVRAGETWGVIGRNGSGKSTLLQILAGTLAPTAGRVAISGKVAALLELGSGFHPEFTGRENVRLAASMLGLSPAEIDARLGSIAAFADIGDFLDRPVKTYSSGMLMRLAFATATSVDAEILLIDEVLAVGDAGFQFKCFDRLTRLVRGGATLVLVSHDMVAVRSLCKHALYLDGGRCRAQGPVDEVAEAYLMDVREDQRRAAGATASLGPRPSLGDGGLPSFGGPEGRIESARFLGSGGSRLAVARGDGVDVDVVVSLESATAWVHLGLLILNDRRIPVAGHRTRLTGERSHGAGAHRLRFHFPARLAPGRYFMNLRLEHGPSRYTALLIEKQTAALELEVLPDGRDDLLGYCDLGIEVVASPVAAEAEPAARAGTNG
jgi:lipopolysaccharide transport system ATP-binding protein